MWWAPEGTHAMFWVAPAGSTGILHVHGDGADAVELRWSTLSAEIPSTRAAAFYGKYISIFSYISIFCLIRGQTFIVWQINQAYTDKCQVYFGCKLGR